jgi:uncharacterized membrane protein YjjB (DUF3815 family)
MEFNLTTVARGLGLPGTQARARSAQRWMSFCRSLNTHSCVRCLICACAQFAVFPSFILVTFSALLSDGHGGKTLYIPTSPVRTRKNDKLRFACAFSLTVRAAARCAARTGAQHAQAGRGGRAGATHRSVRTHTFALFCAHHLIIFCVSFVRANARKCVHVFFFSRSYGTNTPTPFRVKPEGEDAVAAAAAAAADSNSGLGPRCGGVRRRAAALRSRFLHEHSLDMIGTSDATSAAAHAAATSALGRAILELASQGPGFFMFAKHDVDGHNAEEEEEDWAGSTLHGGGAGGGGRGSLDSNPRGSLSAEARASPPPASSVPMPLPRSLSGAAAAAAAAAALLPAPLARAASGHVSIASFSDPPAEGGAAPSSSSPLASPRPPPLTPRPHRSRYARRRDAFLSLALDDALSSLHAIDAAPPLYSSATLVAAMGTAAAGCALTFFGGSTSDAALAGALGALVGGMGTAASASGTRALRAYEFLAAAACAFFARLSDAALSPVCLQPVLLSALIWLLQGWTMTNAVVELATRNPISGTSHLFVGIVTTAMMGFGLDVGSALADMAGLPPVHAQTGAGGSCGRGVSAGWFLPLFLPTTLAFSALLNAHRSQLGPMTALACLAFVASYLFSLAPRTASLASFLAAALVGAAGNGYANATGRPAMPGTCSGIFILVPGALALRSISSLVSAESNGAESNGESSGSVGLGLTSRVLTVAVSIGAGVFMASLLVTPREIVHVRKKALRADAAAAAAPAAAVAPAAAMMAAERAQSGGFEEGVPLALQLQLRGGYHRTMALAPVNM